MQTAQELPYTKLTWKSLDELDAGVCDGMTYEEIEVRNPGFDILTYWHMYVSISCNAACVCSSNTQKTSPTGTMTSLIIDIAVRGALLCQKMARYLTK